MKNKDIKQDFVTLSASRINTLNKCSWVYHANYVLKLPDEGNDGARRGTVTHAVLEHLLKPKNRHYCDAITSFGNVRHQKPVWRLVRAHAAKEGVDDDENMGLIESFLMVALTSDFFCEEDPRLGKGELLPPETKFEISNSEPRYKILGYIDKICLYPEKKIIKVSDYKCSKVKFQGDDKDFNVQAMMYAVAALKLFPEYEKVYCDFLFLKFPKKPVMQFDYTREELSGFELYLEHVNEHLCEFSLKHAVSNFAADSSKNFWLCGKKRGQLNKAGEPAFICRYKYPFTYYAALRDDGSVVKTSMEDGELEFTEWAASEGYKVEKREYGGCPKFRNKLNIS